MQGGNKSAKGDAQTSLRKHLMLVYEAALEAVNGRHCVKRALAQARNVDTGVYVVAIGKAASAMLAGAHEVLGGDIADALLITKAGHVSGNSFIANVQVFEAGHPWPTQTSLDAGTALLKFIHVAPADAQLLFLISGGASSLVEVLPEGVSLHDLHRLNDWLLGSGFDIHAMNHVRKAVSCIKGGRLAQYLNGRSAKVLLISDVPGDDPATIGSGLLVPENLPYIEKSLDLPEWVESLTQKGGAAPKCGDACFENIEIEIVASLADAKHAAAQKARALGYDVYEHTALLGGDAELVGQQLANDLLLGPKALHVWGGETTVRLPDNPGRGGRNQQLALAAAIQLQNEDHIVFLAAATDGTDGPTDDAGAIVDGATVALGVGEGFDPRLALLNADAGSFLDASDDLIQTGPTGTNVMDIMLGIKE